MKGDFKAQGWKGVYCLLCSVDFSAKKQEGEGGREKGKEKQRNEEASESPSRLSLSSSSFAKRAVSHFRKLDQRLFTTF